jgi:hypothetical protein
VFYAARTGRWSIAGLLGGLAAMTRVTGVLLAVPFLLLFFYGPRNDAEPVGRPSRLWPRYSFSPAALWVLLVPTGLGMFAAYLTLRGFGPTGMLHAQEQYSSHQLVAPIIGLWQGIAAAWHEVTLEFSGVAPSTYSNQAILQLGALLIALACIAGTLRKLPFAYAAYAVVALIVPLSSPTVGDPLRGMDRYAALLFPLYMWAGDWCVQRRALRSAVLVMCGVLIFFSAQFATWHWVG